MYWASAGRRNICCRTWANERIHSGDVLLVQGTWSNIARLSKEDSDWVVLGQPLAEAGESNFGL